MAEVKEITLKELKPKLFIEEKAKEIKMAVGDGAAINALSGGVDSSAVTMLGHKALGPKLKTYFIDNGIMRKDEPRQIVDVFKKLGVEVKIVDARDKFFNALKGITDPNRKEKPSLRRFIKMFSANL